MNRVQFESPSALRQFALETAVQLRQAGLSEAGDVLDSAAQYVTGSGWEWLGELGAATGRIRKRFPVPGDLVNRLARIHQAATSRRPYR